MEVEVIYIATGPYGLKLRKYKCSHCAFFFFESPYLIIG